MLLYENNLQKQNTITQTQESIATEEMEIRAELQQLRDKVFSREEEDKSSEKVNNWIDKCFENITINPLQ